MSERYCVASPQPLLRVENLKTHFHTRDGRRARGRRRQLDVMRARRWRWSANPVVARA